MATGRSLPEFERVYLGGYEMSGYLTDTGERGAEFEEIPSRALSDQITGYMCGKLSVGYGPLVGYFDNTPTSGLHAVSTAGLNSRQNVTNVRGVQAAPAIGDDAFCAPMLLGRYKAANGERMALAKLEFAYDYLAGINYKQFFGRLLHPWGSETAANTANTNADNGAATSAGGWMMWHIYSITGAGTVTLSVDDSANGTAWLALSGATTGAIATASAPTSGFVQLATNATVRQYLRHQIAFGGSASACVFGLSFMRG